MQEEVEGHFVHEGTFGEREGLTYEATRALAQALVETLDMIRGATAIGGMMRLGGKALWSLSR